MLENAYNNIHKIEYTTEVYYRRDIGSNNKVSEKIYQPSTRNH